MREYPWDHRKLLGFCWDYQSVGDHNYLLDVPIIHHDNIANLEDDEYRRSSQTELNKNWENDLACHFCSEISNGSLCLRLECSSVEVFLGYFFPC